MYIIAIDTYKDISTIFGMYVVIASILSEDDDSYKCKNKNKEDKELLDTRSSKRMRP
jgi:hypothetical protein